MKVIAQTGRYGAASMEYAGLVSVSYLKRSGFFIVDTGKYSIATVEYAGRSSWSYIRRGGDSIKRCTLRVTEPVVRVAGKPLALFKKKSKKHAVIALYGDKLDEVMTRLDHLDRRLSVIEKEGIRPQALATASEPQKPLPEKQRLVLRTILEDTKALRKSED